MTPDEFNSDISRRAEENAKRFLRRSRELAGALKDGRTGAYWEQLQRDARNELDEVFGDMETGEDDAGEDVLESTPDGDEEREAGG